MKQVKVTGTFNIEDDEELNTDEVEEVLSDAVLNLDIAEDVVFTVSMGE